MPKQPYFPFYTGDWMKDPELSLCSPATRGVWIDLLCAIHELNQQGRIVGTAAQLARVCRCSAVEFTDAATELCHTRTANIETRNGLYTITCRRMAKDQHLKQKRADAGRKGGFATAKAIANALAKPKQLPDTENETDSEVVSLSEGGVRGGGSEPCSIDDCVAHGALSGLPAGECEAFHNYYASSGWMLGGSPVRAWKPLMANWKARWEQRRHLARQPKQSPEAKQIQEHIEIPKLI